MVVVFSKNNCPACTQTKAMLDGLGVEYTERNVFEDPTALQEIIGLGYQAVPVVQAGEEHWAGHQPSKLMALKN